MLRKALLSYRVRFNSTEAKNTDWINDVFVPSRPERLNIPKKPKKQLFSPDLSYLKETPNSLAGRLAKPTLHKESIARNSIKKAVTPESTTETEIDVAVITQRRREARRSREESFKQYVAAITQRRIDARLGRQFDETIRAVQDNADRLNSLAPMLDSPEPLPLPQSARLKRRDPLLDSPVSLPRAQFAKEPFVEKIPDNELSPLALKRREERRQRDSRSSRVRPSEEGSSLSVDMESEDDPDSVELEDASPIAQVPEFNGPEPISESLDLDFGIIQYYPFANGHDSVEVSKSPSYRLNPNLIDSLVGGDYSDYTSLSSSISNSTSPNTLTVVNTAELALSRQRDYIIPQRKHAIEIVKNLVDGKQSQATT